MATATTTTATTTSTGATAAEHARLAADATLPRANSSEKAHIQKISHGRGGAANIAADDTVYADGGIVREGYVGDQGDGPYSTGRGGTANIGAPGAKPGSAADAEIIPETALRSDNHHVFHTGRGGEGNLHHENSATDKPKTKHQHHEHKEGETGSQAPSVNGSGSDSNEEKGKKRRSLFGRNKAEETDPEKLAKKAEHEEKYPPPTHSGLGDKLKYKIFGKLYD